MLNNLGYPIELVRITATVYDKNGVIVATGDKYVNDSEKIKTMAFNVQSDEYSLMTDNVQNNTIPQL